MFEILSRKVFDSKVRTLLREIIQSYQTASNQERERERERVKRGLPIGNLTSQIFANIYLNELDRFVKHVQRPGGYLRYGDDFTIFESTLAELQKMREDTIKFIVEKLNLSVNGKNDIIIKTRAGIRFLGVIIYPNGRKLAKRNITRINKRLAINNFASYYGLLKQHQSKSLKEFNWQILEKIYAE